MLAAILVGSCWGCGSGSVVPPTLIPVKGKITSKGQLVTKGVVRFEPDGFGRMATGQLQSTERSSSPLSSRETESLPVNTGSP